jgi:biopolymer transport protein ExbD
MRFTQGRQRRPPSVIIVSLIDVLLVVLIFLMVSTTFRQTPNVKIMLPESQQTSAPGASPNRVTVTIARSEPHFFIGAVPITFDRLQQELVRLVSANPDLSLTIAPDEAAPSGKLVQLFEAAKAANFRGGVTVQMRPAAPR